MHPLETVSPDEEKLSQDLFRILTLVLRKEYPKGKKVLRDAHPKSHGLLKAKFVVMDGLDSKLQYGLFAKPKEYNAYLRFSNGNRHSTDRQGDIRGVGIKIFGVEGAKCTEGEKFTQDFLLINSKVLPGGNPVDYFQLFSKSTSGKPMEYFFSGMPWDWKIKDFWTLFKIRSQKVESILNLAYYSTTPYAWGNDAVKYSILPQSKPNSDYNDLSNPNYLRERMKRELSTEGIKFDFRIQIRGENQFPIEESGVEWSESKSPFVKVAEIHIPSQNFDTPEQDEIAENLSFDPWHSLVEHTPIGGINRMRKAIYIGISKHRHEKNGIPLEDPIFKE
jgi:hypothetical protein